MPTENWELMHKFCLNTFAWKQQEPNKTKINKQKECSRRRAHVHFIETRLQNTIGIIIKIQMDWLTGMDMERNKVDTK